MISKLNHKWLVSAAMDVCLPETIRGLGKHRPHLGRFPAYFVLGHLLQVIQEKQMCSPHVLGNLAPNLLQSTKRQQYLLLLDAGYCSVGRSVRRKKRGNDSDSKYHI